MGRLATPRSLDTSPSKSNTIPLPDIVTWNLAVDGAVAEGQNNDFPSALQDAEMTWQQYLEKKRQAAEISDVMTLRDDVEATVRVLQRLTEKLGNLRAISEGWKT